MGNQQNLEQRTIHEEKFSLAGWIDALPEGTTVSVALTDLVGSIVKQTGLHKYAPSTTEKGVLIPNRDFIEGKSHFLGRRSTEPCYHVYVGESGVLYRVEMSRLISDFNCRKIPKATPQNSGRVDIYPDMAVADLYAVINTTFGQHGGAKVTIRGCEDLLVNAVYGAIRKLAMRQYARRG